MIYRILEATRLSQFRLSLRQVLTTDSEVALDTVMLKANAKVRIWSSHGVDGRQYVEDGLVPSANNRETGWMERCDMRSASRTDRNAAAGAGAAASRSSRANRGRERFVPPCSSS